MTGDNSVSFARWQRGEQTVAGVGVLVSFGLCADISLHKYHWCLVDGYHYVLGWCFFLLLLSKKLARILLWNLALSFLEIMKSKVLLIWLFSCFTCAVRPRTTTTAAPSTTTTTTTTATTSTTAVTSTTAPPTTTTTRPTTTSAATTVRPTTRRLTTSAPPQTPRRTSTEQPRTPAATSTETTSLSSTSRTSTHTPLLGPVAPNSIQRESNGNLSHRGKDQNGLCIGMSDCVKWVYA